MGDYNIMGLNSRDFEHIVQALAKKQVAAGVTPFGDGKDGAREATYEGKMNYPCTADLWNGYLVLQCKFCKRPTSDPTKDGRWALRELEKDLKNFTSPRRRLRKPDYYIFATNVTLTAAADSGSKDRVRKLLTTYSPKIGLKGFDVWSYDELCRFIDDNSSIRKTYAGFITVGDVLSQLNEWMTLEKPEFPDVMGRFLQKELRNEQAARLESAGRHFDQLISLARVFTDLPATDQPEKADRPQQDPSDESYFPTIAALLSAGTQTLRTVTIAAPDRPGSEIDKECSSDSRFVIVGGPGQGKSTLGQYLAQLYRAAIIKDRPAETVDKLVLQITKQVEEQRETDGATLPKVRRFPVRIILNQYADELAKDKELSILRYLRREISRLGAADCSLADIRRWLAGYPWLVVLDGLDEVPASSNRSELLKEIEDFRIDAASLNADVLFVATTRPQGYSSEFPANYFKHIYLTPLSPEQALRYGRRLVDARCGTDENRKRLVTRRLAKACATNSTARLMQSPLQVTIMATLVEKLGEPPQQRYRLFEQYYRTIYERETGREGSLSEVLSSRKTDIDLIRYRTALLLQTEAEREGKTESRLNEERFRSLVQARLNEVGVVGSEASRLSSQISSGLERLVFLVWPQAGFVGFEIRSLQEFMAAEALLKGSEDSVRERLKRIAPIAHWRNVFLFAVGKCFAEHEHLLEYIDFLCRELNDKSVDDVGEATLWGSRLALDILTEGVAKPHPRFERSLATNALRLVSLPDPQAAVRLSSIYENHLEDLFSAAVSDRLGQIDFVQRTGAWSLICCLADREVRWALDIIDKRWPSSIEEQKSILLANPNTILSPWSLQKAIAVVPKAGPFRMVRLLRRGFSEDNPNRAMPAWWRALSQSLPFSSKRTNHVAFRPFGSTVGWVSVGTLKGPSLREMVPLSELPLDNPDWAPYISAGRFSEKPCRETLANELRWLVERWDPAGMRLNNSPWPLAACIACAKSKDDLAGMAARAESADFGDIADWLGAEERWDRFGLRLEDLQTTTNQSWPFDLHIGERGFPFSAVRGMFDPDAWGDLFKAYQLLPRSKVKSWLAWGMLNVRPRSQEELETAAAIKATPAEILEICEAAAEHGKTFLLEVLDQVETPVPLTREWLQFFNWLGTNYPSFSVRAANGWRCTSQLARAFSSEPDVFQGLISILGNAAAAGNEVHVPPELLGVEQLGNGDTTVGAIAIRLSQKGCTPEEGKKFGDFAGTRPSALWQLFSALKRHNAASRTRATFGLAVLDALRGHVFDGTDYSEDVIQELVQVMEAKSSGIGDPAEWIRLKLPQMT